MRGIVVRGIKRWEKQRECISGRKVKKRKNEEGIGGEGVREIGEKGEGKEGKYGTEEVRREIKDMEEGRILGAKGKVESERKVMGEGRGAR